MSFLRSLGASIIVVSVAHASAACSSSGNSTGNSVAGDRNSFIRQICDAYMPCCTKAGKPADGNACRSFYTAFTAESPYDAAAANKCLDEVRAQSGSATFCDDGANNTSSCGKVFGGNTGTAKPGETCNEAKDCAPSTEGEVECQSAFSGGATIKKCQVQVPGKLGDTPCAGTVDGNTTSSFGGSDTDVPAKAFLCYVKDGLRCDSTSKACKPISKIGEACEGFGPYLCTKDAYCDTTKKLCTARKPVSQPCDTFSEQCVETAYCNATTKLCAAKVATGGACTTRDECVSESCTNGKCEADSGSSALLCGD